MRVTPSRGASQVDGVAVILCPCPDIVGDNFCHAWVGKTRFFAQVNRQVTGKNGCGQGSAGCTNSPLAHTALTVAATTLFAGSLVQGAVIALANGANFMTDRAEFFLAKVAVRGMYMTGNMPTVGIVIAVIRAETLLAQGAGGATSRTEIGLAVGAGLNGQRPTATAWTLDQTGVTIRLVVHDLVKTWPHGALTSCTTYQTALTKTLTTGATGPNFGAILLTAQTMERTVATDVSSYVGQYFDLVNP